MQENQSVQNFQGKSWEELQRGRDNKFLVFSLYSERYGVPLSHVLEVISLTNIYTVPKVPEWFRGIINLRGKIIPIIDLRNRVSGRPIEDQPRKTSIIITRIDTHTVGAVVDEVQEVVGLEHHQIDRDARTTTENGQKVLMGVARVQEQKLILLLDINNALSMEEKDLIAQEYKIEAA